MRILIAEDDTVSRLLLQRAVEASGHDCLAAVDGQQAWELFGQTEVDVIISDRQMPEMDGMELCRRVRQQTRDLYTYFIFLTALSEHEQLLSGIEAGADDYLTKPLDPDELKVRLNVASRITSLHRQLAEQKAELKRLNEQLYSQARRDALTQLGNRLRLREDLEIVAARVESNGVRYSAIMGDVDFFKLYNDHYGHAAGDEVLRAVANVIAQHCRNTDVAYRYGGEEFLIILSDQTPDAATVVAERLRQKVESLNLPHVTKTPPGVVTLSLGMATLEPGTPQAVQLWLKRADDALYQAKQSGRNRVVVSAVG